MGFLRQNTDTVDTTVGMGGLKENTDSADLGIGAAIRMFGINFKL